MAEALRAEGVSEADADLLNSLRHVDFDDDEEISACRMTITKKE